MNIDALCRSAARIEDLVCLAVLVSTALGVLLSFVTPHRDQVWIEKTAERRVQWFKTSYFFIAAFFGMLVILYFPIFYYHANGNDVKAILLSIFQSLRLFVLDGDPELIDVAMQGAPEMGYAYTVRMYIHLIIAPLFTASMVLSFFKNACATIRYHLGAFRDIYLMSELNERSVALAEDILLQKRFRPQILFADVFEKEEEENFELVSRARRMGALCFRRDVTDISLKLCPWIKRKIYLIGSDEDENVQQALHIISSCRKKWRYNRSKTEFYVFTGTVESEALLNTVDNGKMKVRRIRRARNLALKLLQHDDYALFTGAKETAEGKLINAVIVGLGEYGTELLKALCWCGQLEGYTLQIHAFDGDADAKKKLRAVCPALMDYNRKRIAGEPYYNICVHSGVDVNSEVFLSELSAIPDITASYVMLGNDELNVKTAMRMRMQYGRDHIAASREIPPIYAVVYSSIKSKILAREGGFKSTKGEDYGIKIVGSMRERYSLALIEQTKLEEQGMRLHKRWCGVHATPEEIAEAERTYEKYEYNRRSSISQAVHRLVRERLGIVPIEGDAERNRLIEQLEHKRWNAYMRAEGYIYMPKKDDIAKTHCDLISATRLNESQIEKDAVMVQE